MNNTPKGADAEGESSRRSFYHGMVWVAVALIAAAIGVWLFGPPVWRLVRDPIALERFVVRLGWFGPLALILTNALQIVVAPIPGYVVQIAAGFLYGPIWGGIWGSLGMLLGGMTAMWLARTFGRPLVERLVGRARLDRWETVTHSTSTLVWCIMLLGPTGDVPYYLAGMARVSFAKIFLIMMVIRVPSVFVAAAAGSGVMLLNWWQLAIIIAALSAVVVGFFRYQEQIMGWLDGQVRRQVSSTPVAGELSQE